MLWAELYALDAVVERQSPGFVEEMLQMFSNSTGHVGLINIEGELLDCAPNGRPSAKPIPHDAHNRSVQLQLATQPAPARSLDDVRTVVADLLRRSLYANAGPTEAAVRARAALSKIRMQLQQPEEETGPNISLERTRRLRQLAAIEAEALEAYLKSPGLIVGQSESTKSS